MSGSTRSRRRAPAQATSRHPSRHPDSTRDEAYPMALERLAHSGPVAELEVRNGNTDNRELYGLCCPYNTSVEIRGEGHIYNERLAPGLFSRSIRETSPAKVKLH